MFGGASNVADKVDAVFLYISALTIAFLVFITFLMIYFVIRYRRGSGRKPEDIHGHTLLELLWTGIPLVLFLSMFYYGWTNYRTMRDVPRDAMVVKVTARQWAWSFTYPNGKQTTELYLPINRPVRLDLKSVDVLHGFYVPAFRVKEDVVPGKDNYVWFQPNLLGEYDVECTVMCGANHSYMLSKVKVYPEVDFSAWYFSDSLDPPGLASLRVPHGAPDPIRGERAFRLKGCVACHTNDGSKLIGPTLKGIYATKIAVGRDGKDVTQIVDDAYLARSMTHPPSDVVKGFDPQMPKIELSEGDIVDLTAYIKSLK